MDYVKAPDRATEERLVQMMNEWQLTLMRTCCAMLGDADLARDAVQETFLKAYKALPSFQGNSSEKTWLMHIAMNVCRDMRRGSWFRIVNRHVSLEDLPEPTYEPMNEDHILVDAVMNLPTKEREVVILHYYQNLTLQETADALGISQPAVSKRLKKAKNKLKNAWKEGEL